MCSIEDRRRRIMKQERTAYLTEFLKSVCDVSQESAEKNARSIENGITEEVFQGICAFMQLGITYDRIMKWTDLNLLYGKGEYWAGAAVYYAKQTVPRRLAPENGQFSSDARVTVDEESFIYLVPCRPMGENVLWYQNGERWEKAAGTKKGYRIPSRAFVYQISKQAPLYSGKLTIALSGSGEVPSRGQKRVLQLHLLKKVKPGGKRYDGTSV